MVNVKLCSAAISLAAPGLSGVFSLLEEIRQCCSDFKHAQPQCMNFLDTLNLVKNELEKQNQDAIKDNGLLDRYKSLVIRFHESVSKCAAENNVAIKTWKMYRMKGELPGYYDELGAITSAMSTVTLAISLDLKDRLEKDTQVITKFMIDQLQTTNELCGAIENIRNRGDSLEELAQKMKRDLNAADEQKNISPALLHALKNMVTDIEKRLGDTDLGTPPKWMIASDEILLHERLTCDDADEEQQIYIGEWQNSEVAIKVFDMALSSKVLIKSLTIWRELLHPHIATLYGAGLMKDGKPFYVYDYALHQSLDRCIDKWARYRWQMLYQAATALQHLHKNKFVHGNVSCAKMLVDASGKIKLYGFEASYLRENSKSNSIRPVTRDEHRAPECFGITGNGQLEGIDHSPTFKSDVYSFGIAILETFKVRPFDRANGILRNLISLKKRSISDKFKPKTMSDKTWSLIKSMLERDQNARAPLSMVIEELRELAQEETKLRENN